jgi:UDP-N-acetyl-D-glucosamine/UDP-N-acetyl-D-galactosamine dehydrogenase
VMGATFKENVSDIRNSKIADVVKELKAFSLNVHITDPHAESGELKHEYGFELTPVISNDYDAVIITVPHNAFKHFDDAYFSGITKENALIADLKGIYRNKISNRNYWSL